MGPAQLKAGWMFWTPRPHDGLQMKYFWKLSILNPLLNQNLEEEGAEDPGDRHEDCNERSDLDVGQHSARRQNVCFVFSFNEFPSFMWNLVGRRQTPALRVVMAAMLTWCDNYDDKDDEDGHEDYNNPNLGEGENNNDQLQKKW